MNQDTNSRQQVLESLFFTVDTIKNDLSKCGMRLSDLKSLFNYESFSNTNSGYKSTYGLSAEELSHDTTSGENTINISGTDFFKANRKIVIFNKTSLSFEFSNIKKVNNLTVVLNKPLKNMYPKGSLVIPLKEIQLKLFKKEKVLKRKIDNGHFLPVLENVTDFYVSFFLESNSVLYRLCLNNKEQVRGYIFLTKRVGNDSIN